MFFAFFFWTARKMLNDMVSRKTMFKHLSLFVLFFSETPFLSKMPFSRFFFTHANLLLQLLFFLFFLFKKSFFLPYFWVRKIMFISHLSLKHSGTRVMRAWTCILHSALKCFWSENNLMRMHKMRCCATNRCRKDALRTWKLFF